MYSYVLISVLYIQSVWSFAEPNASGDGVFAYQDSDGNRYGGTYRLKDGQVVERKGDFPPNFQYNTIYDSDNFYPEYFRNLGNLLQEAFNTNYQNQESAFNAARKAFDLTSNQAGYFPNFYSALPGFNSFPNFRNFQPQPFPGPIMPNLGGGYSAFAGAAAVPGYSQQIAAINPANPGIPNVNQIYRNAIPPNGNNGGYMSVSSSSYSSSKADADGNVKNSRGAETIVNDNGKITKHVVHN